jgi:predicted nucleic acid-binding Zn ribbon protein
MNQDSPSNHCGICEAAISSDLSVCSECEKAFESAPEAQPVPETTSLDLEKYSCRMFPWEQSSNQLQLISANRAWLILALGLVVLVVLLALLRTPLPSCWELAS